MIDGCVNLKRCVVCDNRDIKQVLDLGDQPLANSFLDTPQIENKYPLRVNACDSCQHLQLSHAVDPTLMYNNYLYRSGTTDTYREYMKGFAKLSVNRYFNMYNQQAKTVLDVGCNDGTQLDQYKQLGLRTFGVDPAENLYQYSSKNHTVINDYFRDDVRFFEQEHFDIVVMQNSFAHQSNPQQFLEDLADVMHDNSLLYIQTSQADMVRNNEFDTIYHEHVNFYCVSSMLTLVERAGMNIVDIKKQSIHGISYVFVLSRDHTKRNNRVIDQYLLEENAINSMSNYKQWATNVVKVKQDYLAMLKAQQHTRIVGYGAAAKGNTFLNFCNQPVEFVVDDNELKQNKYTPGLHIPIRSIQELNKVPADQTITFVPLAWNFFDEIRQRIKQVRNNPNDRFVRYFPKAELTP